MNKIDIFGDGRKTPKIKINVKAKIKSNNQAEINNWNRAFGYIMKKPRTKLEFIMVDHIRSLFIDKIYLDDIKNYISEEDYNQLKKVEKIFNDKITPDVKAFILSILKVKITILENIINSKT